MRYQQIRFIGFFMCLAFILSGCQTTDTPDTPFSDWDYSRERTQAANEPAQIGTSHAQQTPEIFKEQTSNQPDNSAATHPPQQEGLYEPQTLKTPTYQSVRVAILLPLSGPQENLGRSLLQTAQMALFDVGQSHFELTPYDTQGTGDGARHAAAKAISDGAQLILGPIFANSVRAAKSVVRYHNVNMIAFSTDWSVTSSNVFIMGFLPFDQIERIMRYAAAQGHQRIAAIAPQTTYGRAIISAYQTLAPQFGIENIDTLSYDPNNTNLAPDIKSFAKYDERNKEAQTLAASLLGGTDTKTARFKAEVTRIKNEMESPYDAVLVVAGGEHVVTISNLLSHYGLSPNKVKRLGIGLFDDDALAGEFALKDAWFSAPSLQSRKNFNQRYNALFAETPPRLASLAYDATALTAILAQTGINYNGQPNFNRNAITNPNGFAGVDGIFRFLDNGTVERGLAILSFDDEKIIEIDPAPNTFQQY